MIWLSWGEGDIHYDYQEIHSTQYAFFLLQVLIYLGKSRFFFLLFEPVNYLLTILQEEKTERIILPLLLDQVGILTVLSFLSYLYFKEANILVSICHRATESGDQK